MPDTACTQTRLVAARETTGRKNTPAYLIGDDSTARGLYNILQTAEPG
jgi:hypothetical protein